MKADGFNITIDGECLKIQEEGCSISVFWAPNPILLYAFTACKRRSQVNGSIELGVRVGFFSSPQEFEKVLIEIGFSRSVAQVAKELIGNLRLEP